MYKQAGFVEERYAVTFAIKNEQFSNGERQNGGEKKTWNMNIT